MEIHFNDADLSQINVNKSDLSLSLENAPKNPLSSAPACTELISTIYIGEAKLTISTLVMPDLLKYLSAKDFSHITCLYRECEGEVKLLVRKFHVAEIDAVNYHSWLVLMAPKLYNSKE